MQSRTCAVLLEDPRLGERLSEERRLAAARTCLSRSVSVDKGPWSPRVETSSVRDGLGLLVLDGLLTRRIGLDGRFGAEMLGGGDLLRPWQPEDLESALPHVSGWTVLRASRMAVLDREFTLKLAPYPEVTAALLARAVRRSRQLVLNMAIMHQPRVDVRLHMLLWDLAHRWGRVHRDGVHLRMELTHAALADMVAAARPTVTTALGELAARGAVRWSGETWILTGSPLAALRELDRG